jgi:CHAD domain-containing protein
MRTRWRRTAGRSRDSSSRTPSPPRSRSRWPAKSAGRIRDVQEAIAETGIVYAVEPLHRIRIAAKKLRYTLEVGSRALAGAGPKARRELRLMQSRLGDLHDLQILQEHVRAAAAEAAGEPAMAADLAAMDRVIEVRCRQAHAGILRTRPRLEAALHEVDHAASVLDLCRARSDAR